VSGSDRVLSLPELLFGIPGIRHPMFSKMRFVLNASLIMEQAYAGQNRKETDWR
jgi:hypothetical protein